MNKVEYFTDLAKSIEKDERRMNDDVISRQTAIDAFRKELCRERVYATPFISFKGCERILNELPSAERHGRWVDLHCSVCGKIGWMDEDNYCPNCGAKMDEVEE